MIVIEGKKGWTELKLRIFIWESTGSHQTFRDYTHQNPDEVLLVLLIYFEEKKS